MGAQWDSRLPAGGVRETAGLLGLLRRLPFLSPVVPKVTLNRPQSDFSFQLSVFSFQFSVFSFQFSVFSFQLSASISNLRCESLPIRVIRGIRGCPVVTLSCSPVVP